MAKNIVLLSDGTGNSAAKLFKTNVWRLYEALDLGDAAEQVAFYDNGVGTSSFKPLAILGGAFGFGLKRNVTQIYRFCCRHYQAGDRIFGFGFSRGAFTIRVVAGVIALEGLVPYSGDEAQLARDANVAYRRYRKNRNFKAGANILVTPLRALRDVVDGLWRRLRRLPQFDPRQQRQVDEIHFMGVWDTVAAYGGPIDEITRGIDHWLWPLSMPDRLMNAKIKRACHALALDDERNSFWPLLWDEQQVSGRNGPQPMLQNWAPPRPPEELAEIDRQRLSQVWFTGMHSDVGGGYPQDGLSYVTLDWMMDRAEVYGLQLRRRAREDVAQFADPFDKLNDSRHGLAGYYRYKPRKLVDIYAADVEKPTLRGDIKRVAQAVNRTLAKPAPDTAASESARPAPMIHESVFRRMQAKVAGYAPIVLPESYRMTDKAGGVGRATYESPTQATRRANGQERAWNWVWGRRVVYFLTLFATLALAAFPLIEKTWPGTGGRSVAAFVIPLIDFAGAFLPNLVSPWLTAFKSAPGWFVAGAALVATLLLWGGSLQRRIGDGMRQAWCRVTQPGIGDGPPCDAPHDLLCRARNSQWYRGFFYALTHWVLPALCAILIVYGVFVASSRVLFAAGESFGLVCEGSRESKEVVAPETFDFDTRKLCHPSALGVVADKTYKITLALPAPWEDGYQPDRQGIVTDPNGFGWDKTRWTMVAGIPLRRHLTEDWFRTIVRVGNTGSVEQPLSFKEVAERKYEARFKAGASGEVFLFVNDAVIGLPWIGDIFYLNNKGSANVRIEREGS